MRNTIPPAALLRQGDQTHTVCARARSERTVTANYKSALAVQKQIEKLKAEKQKQHEKTSKRYQTLLAQLQVRVRSAA